MHAFCPCCANLLSVQRDEDGQVHYQCMSCPYAYRLRYKRRQTLHTTKKHIEPVFRGDDAFRGGQKTETGKHSNRCGQCLKRHIIAVCPKCGHHEASFIEMQTRSADEPMTVFCQCAKCKAIWKE